jgi:hypothetical protein
MGGGRGGGGCCCCCCLFCNKCLLLFVINEPIPRGFTLLFPLKFIGRLRIPPPK